MPAPKKKEVVKPMNGLYMQNKEGRVFVATPELIKQAGKGKFGLVRISKSVYDEALKNGGMTAPIEDLPAEDL